MNSPIIRNQCLKCGAVRYEEQRFLVMCKVCDCIMKDRKLDDRKEIDKKVKEIVEAIEEARKHPEEIEMVLKDIDSLDASTCKDEELGSKRASIFTHPDKNSPQTKPDRVESDNSRRNVADEQRENTVWRDKTGDNHSQVSLKASRAKSGDGKVLGRRLPTAESTSAPDTHNPKLKFMCTCVEPRPCSHELAIKEKTKLMTEEFNDWKECVDKEMAKHDKKIDKKLKELRRTL